jgi:hypothetical protein
MRAAKRTTGVRSEFQAQVFDRDLAGGLMYSEGVKLTVNPGTR